MKRTKTTGRHKRKRSAPSWAKELIFTTRTLSQSVEHLNIKFSQISQTTGEIRKCIDGSKLKEFERDIIAVMQKQLDLAQTTEVIL